MRRASSLMAALCAIFSLLALQSTGCADPSATAEAAAPASRRIAGIETRPAFWRVDGPSGTTLYLLGSVHVGPAEGWRYPPSIVAAFEKSSRLIVEIDSRTLDAALQQELIIENALLPPGQTLQDKLSEQTWTLLVAELEESRLDVAAVERMRPWMVSNLLVLDAADRSGLTPARGVDQDFIRRAGPREVVALETARFQMSLLAGLSDELQEIALLDILGHDDDVQAYLHEMVEAWRLGDEAALTALVFEELEGSPEFAPFYDALIFQRNRSMAAAMAALLERPDHAGETSFAVVGAAHLVGDRGIGAALAGRGYRVERVATVGVAGPAVLAGRSGQGVELAVDR